MKNPPDVSMLSLAIFLTSEINKTPAMEIELHPIC